MSESTASSSFYAVARGRTIGVYRSWDDCEVQIKGFVNARYKKFHSESEAIAYVTRFNPNFKPVTSASASVSNGPSNGSTDDHPKESRITVYCDGACKSNGKPKAVAGVGVWWGPKDKRNIAERCPGLQTNNRAELIALVRVLETTPRSRTPLLIRTDSQYTIDCFTKWIHQWKRNGWKRATGQPVKNEGIIRYIDALLTEREEDGQKVKLGYVAGHKGQKGNEGADQLANEGCLLLTIPDRDWADLEATVLQKLDRNMIRNDVPPVSPVINDDSTPIHASRDIEKQDAVPLSSFKKDVAVRSQAIPIPIKLKWAEYEPIPRDWLLNPDPYTPSASSASYFSSSTSSSLASSQSSVLQDKEETESDDLRGMSSEELASFFANDDELAQELADD